MRFHKNPEPSSAITGSRPLPEFSLCKKVRIDRVAPSQQGAPARSGLRKLRPFSSSSLSGPYRGARGCAETDRELRLQLPAKQHDDQLYSTLPPYAPSPPPPHATPSHSNEAHTQYLPSVDDDIDIDFDFDFESDFHFQNTYRRQILDLASHSQSGQGCGASALDR
ncbi:hypothetical protein HYFRA_00013900 [Hymenoscyphus fraxineus]|uniref:Uncharacterized protein n=1 Tax=Hymenoscyphus fraxineus TaxID=746836 RepID=A0A9N9L6T0_9HELO|nr:hypothetical protein HYFRA_00013900 [Hymenoscyphus fraxineus]